MYNKYLDIFIEVVDCGSFTKASKNLFISSTAIMKQINNMENDVGVKLLERTHQGIKLTEAGKQIYKDSKYIIELSKQAIQNAQKLGKNKNTIITVGTSVICPCKPLMDIWYKINEDYPNYKIKIVPFEDNHTSTLATLKNAKGQFDCIVTPNDSDEWKKNFNFLKLGEYTYTACMPKNHKLAKKKKLDWKDLSNETIMMITEGDSKVTNKLRELILKNCENVTIKPVPFLYDISVFNECEEKGYILMSLDSWKDVHPTLVNIPLKHSAKIPYGIVYSKEPSKSMNNFISVIKNNI